MYGCVPAGIIPIDLIEQLNKGYCVLFVGDELDGTAQCRALADRGGLHEACPVPDCQRRPRCALPGHCALPFSRAAQLYQSQSGRNDLVCFVRDFVEEHYPNRPILPVFEAVARLPVPVIITTAYDTRLEEALRAAGRRQPKRCLRFPTSSCTTSRRTTQPSSSAAI